jgi:hypothetical protein
MPRKGNIMGIEIKINDKYTITSDAHCYAINETRFRGEDSKNPGEQFLYPIAFYGTLYATLNNISEHALRRSDCKTMDDVLSLLLEYKKIVDDIAVRFGLQKSAY